MKHLRRFLDEKSEVAALIVATIGMAWLAAAAAVKLRELSGDLSPWPGVALLGLALVTYAGKKTFEGVSVGPQGVTVERDDQ